MPAEEPLHVIVADGDAFARRLIKGALRDAGMTVVAEAGDGREALELCLHYRPDVIVIDVVMPGLDGIQTTRRILKGNPDQLVVVLTGTREEEFGLSALRAGAVGFLSKDIEIDALPRALAAVCDGEAAVSRAMTGRLIERYREQPDGPVGLRPIHGPLTTREWEVVDLLKPGHSTDHVADALVISTETVRSHLKNIMRKLGVHSRADAVAAVERLRTTAPGARG
jgi:two-component system nitrate/nitrite response regulator NarL